MQLAPATMEGILKTHLIGLEYLRQDDFEGFFRDRKAALLKLVEKTKG